MRKTLLTTMASLLILGGCAMAEEQLGMSQAGVTAPPGGDYKKVSSLVPLPEFIPGLGTLYVQPDTLPAGPFLAYDRSGRLVSTIYMIPMDDMTAQRKFDSLAVGPDETVKHVSMYYNAGHPGVEKPHYHIVLWHVSPQTAALE